MHEQVKDEILKEINSEILFIGIVLRKSKLVKENLNNERLLFYSGKVLISLLILLVVVCVSLLFSLNNNLIVVLAAAGATAIKPLANIINKKFYKRIYKEDYLSVFVITNDLEVITADFMEDKYKMKIMNKKIYKLFDDITLLYDDKFIYIYDFEGDIIEAFLNNELVPECSSYFWNNYIATTMEKKIPKKYRDNVTDFKSVLYRINSIKNEF